MTPSFALEQRGQPYEPLDVGDASDAGAFTSALDTAARPLVAQIDVYSA